MTRMTRGMMLWLLSMLLGVCAGCAVRATQVADPAADPADSERSKPKPVTTPGPRSRDVTPTVVTNRPATLLSPLAGAGERPSDEGSAWRPDWFAEGLRQDGTIKAACAVYDAIDLLEARHGAVRAAEAFLANPGEIDRTATRLLPDGTYRVWVRMVQAG